MPAISISKFRKFATDHPFALLLVTTLITVVSALVVGPWLKLDAFQSTIIGFTVFAILTVLQLSFYILQQSSDLDELKRSTHELQAQLAVTNGVNYLKHSPEIQNGVRKLVDNIDSALAIISLREGNQSGALDDLFRAEVGRELRRCADSVEQVRAGSLRVVGHESHELWTNVLGHVQQTFFTTNIFRFRESLLGSRSSQHLLDRQTQVVKRLEPNKFERLFVYDEADENEVKNIVSKQKSIGINAWCIDQGKYLEISNDGNWVQKIGSEDFSIIDDRYLYLTIIDRNTMRVSYVEVHQTGARLNAAIEFVNRIKSMTKLFEGK